MAHVLSLPRAKFFLVALIQPELIMSYVCHQKQHKRSQKVAHDIISSGTQSDSHQSVNLKETKWCGSWTAMLLLTIVPYMIFDDYTGTYQY